ncbi:MAG: endolytic transglycosylase MltG [Pseudomonadota bacterium]
MFRWLGRLIAVLFALVLLVAAGMAFAFWQFGRPGPLQSETIVVIPRGVGLSAVAEQLESAGVIDNSYLFMAGVVLADAQGGLRFGEYAFPPSVSGEEVMEIIESGRTVVHSVTIPEGWQVYQVIDLLEEDDRLSGEIEVIPDEGTLLPETYNFDRGMERQAILDRMSESMEAAVAELWEDRAEGLPIETPEDAVILASIIERETGVSGERALVASVFVNRLERGMPLQTDPTVAYALTLGEGPLGREITRADWEYESPYNTYVVDGLPPGPIANPGRAALEAALHPEDTNYLYFVADGSGGHAFAESLEEHNRNAAEWYRLRDAAEEN